MKIVHSRGSYDVNFVEAADVREMIQGAIVITDTNVRSHWPCIFPASTLALPPGEETKCLAQLGHVLEWLANVGTNRKSTIFAVGGGVIGDLVGFAAATFMRGIQFHQVPTSLLAMVDSSVGGKVGIDLAAGKNLAGAFHPPIEVSIAPEFLSTLPPRQIQNGMAEVWKYGFIMDANLVGQLKTAGQPNWLELVRRCIALKAQVVSEDEFETLGRRAILNFGHTIGHAVEQTQYRNGMLHGEAIAIGMAMEARLGEILGITPSEVATGVNADLTHAGFNTDLPIGVSADELLVLMGRDKKSIEGNLAFSLLTGRGACKLVTNVDPTAVRHVLTTQ